MRIGIDIGGTKTEAVAIDASGAVVAETRMPSGFGDEEVLSTAVTALRELGRLDADDAHGDTIGIGIPGAVDSRTGRVEHAVNLGLTGLDLGRELHSRIGRRVRVENDVNAAALGVFAALGGGPEESMAYLNLGTGVAAGLVLGGRLWRGARGTAGEVGHIPVDPEGERCLCGQRGCLEMVAAGRAVERAWPSGGPTPARDLFESAAAGDARAVAVRDRFADGVAQAVRMLALSIDVDRVVIGGGLSRLGDPLLAVVRDALDVLGASSPFVAGQDLPARVSLAPHDVPLAAVGAALAGEEA